MTRKTDAPADGVAAPETPPGTVAEVTIFRRGVGYEFHIEYRDQPAKDVPLNVLTLLAAKRRASAYMGQYGYEASGPDWHLDKDANPTGASRLFHRAAP